jgi:hypothetical protein
LCPVIRDIDVKKTFDTAGVDYKRPVRSVRIVKEHVATAGIFPDLIPRIKVDIIAADVIGGAVAADIDAKAILGDKADVTSDYFKRKEIVLR